MSVRAILFESGKEPNIPLTKTKRSRWVELREGDINSTQATSITGKEERLPTLLFPDDSSDDSIWVKCRNGRDEQNAQSKKGASKSNHATLRGERGTSKLGTAKAGNTASKQNRLVHGDAVPNLNIRIDAAGSKPAHS